MKTVKIIGAELIATNAKDSGNGDALQFTTMQIPLALWLISQVVRKFHFSCVLMLRLFSHEVPAGHLQ